MCVNGVLPLYFSPCLFYTAIEIASRRSLSSDFPRFKYCLVRSRACAMWEQRGFLPAHGRGQHGGILWRHQTCSIVFRFPKSALFIINLDLTFKSTFFPLNVEQARAILEAHKSPESWSESSELTHLARQIDDAKQLLGCQGRFQTTKGLLFILLGRFCAHFFEKSERCSTRESRAWDLQVNAITPSRCEFSGSRQPQHHRNWSQLVQPLL